jgi:hypothetical protein
MATILNRLLHFGRGDSSVNSLLVAVFVRIGGASHHPTLGKLGENKLLGAVEIAENN